MSDPRGRGARAGKPAVASELFDRMAPAYALLASPERIRADADAIERHLRLIGAKRVLDAGCATGFHTLELARRGFETVGIDLSGTMIREARSRARGTALPARFRRMDLAGASTLGRGRFDAVLCLGNTMASVRTRSARRAVLRSLRACLREGGLLIVQMRDLTRIGRDGLHFPVRSHRRDGEEWILLRRQEPQGRRVRFVSTLLHRRGPDGEWERIESATLQEPVPPAAWREIARACGFSRLRLASDLRGTARPRVGAADLVIFARAG